MRLMERLGVRYADTRAELGLEGGYATMYHLVVHGWVPSRCILGTVSGVLFAKLYRSSGISCASQSNIRGTSTWYIALSALRLYRANPEQKTMAFMMRRSLWMQS